MRFAIGLDDFKKLRTLVDSKGRHNFYCDKSLLIKDLIDDGSEIILLPRPRRFGKSLNLSMLLKI
ncbi:MAG: AAA family ATPase [Myxococcaceae bacterium]|nr:AAA family ATPase [Myxococcaceae bacterium]MBH2005802.1 AAA family ATPase [Myxococcaceae bacterium]